MIIVDPEKKYERKTNLPLLHIKIHIGDGRNYISKQYLDNLANILKRIKERYNGVYETIATPDNISIEMESSPVNVLVIKTSADLGAVIKELDRIGGKKDDSSGK